MVEIKKDLLIIGAGPAGLGAALYSKRADLDFEIVDKQMPGGQIMNTEFIENYLGFGQRSGFELIEKFSDHCKGLGAEVKTFCPIALVELVKRGKENFFRCNIAESADHYMVRTIIVASGAYPKMLGLEGEQRLFGRGVSYCATCDGPLYRDKDVAVVGGGDTAVEEALFLAKFAKKVYIIHRRDKLRAVSILQERAFDLENVEIVWNSVLEKIVGEKKMDHILIKNVDDNKIKKIDIQGLFEYVGFGANSALVKGIVKLDANGFIITDKYMRTSCRGIYAAGDVRSTALRQVVTAVADGAVAATSIDKHLRGLI